MYLELTPESINVISTIHTLEFFVLCPDGRRFPVSELCAEYSKKPDGLFMKSFADRLLLVLEAVFPDGRVYWHQAFYLSTGTSVNSYKGRVASNDARANTWMPYHGLVVKGGSMTKKKLSFAKGKLQETDASPAIEMRHFYFLKTAHLESSSGFDPTRKPSGGWNTLTYERHEKTAEEVKEEEARTLLESTFGSFLPEGYYRNMQEKRSPLFDRFELLSYLLASHDLGGNAFAQEASEFVGMNPNLMVLPPLLSRTGEVRNIDFQTEFPEFCKRFATPSPPQACLQEASTSVPITKPNVVNEFLTRQGAIGRMNVFRSIGEDDIPLPGLNVSSVLIQNLGYEVPLEEYDQLLNTYVAYCFLEYKLGKVSKGDLVRLLQEPMTTILAQRNKQRPERFHLFSPSDPGFVVTVQDVETEKNYRGGRKSRRTRRRHNRKRASRRKH